MEKSSFARSPIRVGVPCSERSRRPCPTSEAPCRLPPWWRANTPCRRWWEPVPRPSASRPGSACVLMATTASSPSWADGGTAVTGQGSGIVLHFRDIGINDRPTVGGKGASLGELTQAGIRVPPGFVVSTRAFERFLAGIDPQGLIRRAPECLADEILSRFFDVTYGMRERVARAPMPAEIPQ